MAVAFVSSASAFASSPAPLTVTPGAVARSTPDEAVHLIVVVQWQAAEVNPSVLSVSDTAATDPFYGSLYTAGENAYERVLQAPVRRDFGDLATGFLGSGGDPQIGFEAPSQGTAYNGYTFETVGIGTPDQTLAVAWAEPDLQITVATNEFGDPTSSWSDIVSAVTAASPLGCFVFGADFGPLANDASTLEGGRDPLFPGAVRMEAWAACVLHPLLVTDTVQVAFSEAADWAHACVLAYTGIRADPSLPGPLALTGLVKAVASAVQYNGVYWRPPDL